MKKSLLVTASFFVLGALWMSPLHGMEVEDKENKGGKLSGVNTRQIRPEIMNRLFLEEDKVFKLNLNDILKIQGSENPVHVLKRNKKAFHDLEESFKNNEILKLQGNKNAIHDLEQSFEKLRLLFLEVPEGDNSQS